MRGLPPLGRRAAINYRDRGFRRPILQAEGGANLILDMVGGDYMPRNMKALADDGRLVQIAFLQGPKVELNFAEVMMRRLTITGSTLRPQSDLAKARIAAPLTKANSPAPPLAALQSGTAHRARCGPPAGIFQERKCRRPHRMVRDPKGDEGSNACSRKNAVFLYFLSKSIPGVRGQRPRRRRADPAQRTFSINASCIRQSRAASSPQARGRRSGVRHRRTSAMRPASQVTVIMLRSMPGFASMKASSTTRAGRRMSCCNPEKTPGMAIRRRRLGGPGAK
jgi:hypothetical protein